MKAKSESRSFFENRANYLNFLSALKLTSLGPINFPKLNWNIKLCGLAENSCQLFLGKNEKFFFNFDINNLKRWKIDMLEHRT